MDYIVDVIREQRDSHEILKEIFDRVAESSNIDIRYRDAKEILNQLESYTAKDVIYHKAVNSKLMNSLFESLMSKAILAIERYIDAYMSKVDVVLATDTNIQTVVGSIRALFDLINQANALKEKYVLGDPDRVLSQENQKIDRKLIDELRGKVNDLSNRDHGPQ